MKYRLRMDFHSEEDFERCPIIAVLIPGGMKATYYSREEFLKKHPHPFNANWIYIGINLIITSDFPITVPSWQHSFIGGLEYVSRKEDISSDSSRVVGSTHPNIGWKIDSGIIESVINCGQVPDYIDKEIILLDDTFILI